jgi:hypothetical protein
VEGRLAILVGMGETHGAAPSRVLIFTRDGRALCAYAELPYGVARLMRDDLRHWLVGSRSLDYRTADGHAASLRGDEVEAIEVVVDE